MSGESLLPLSLQVWLSEQLVPDSMDARTLTQTCWVACWILLRQGPPPPPPLSSRSILADYGDYGCAYKARGFKQYICSLRILDIATPSDGTRGVNLELPAVLVFLSITAPTTGCLCSCAICLCLNVPLFIRYQSRLQVLMTSTLMTSVLNTVEWLAEMR